MHREGFRAVTVGDAAQLLRHNTDGVPAQRLMAITFDDGCQSFLEHAFPVLRELGYQATVFVITGPGGSTDVPNMTGKRRLTWDQLGRIHESGMEIGAHTVTHPNLACLEEADIIAELEGSRAAIAERVGARVASFAYPFGSYNDRTRTLAHKYFECACTTDLGLADSGSDVYALERLEMHYFRNEATIRLLFSPWLPQYITLRSVFRAARRRARG